MPEVQTLLTGLAIGESPRWHEDRLWFSNWGTQEVVAEDLTSQLMEARNGQERMTLLTNFLVARLKQENREIRSWKKASV